MLNYSIIVDTGIVANVRRLVKTATDRNFRCIMGLLLFHSVIKGNIFLSFSVSVVCFVDKWCSVTRL